MLLFSLLFILFTIPQPQEVEAKILAAKARKVRQKNKSTKKNLKAHKEYEKLLRKMMKNPSNIKRWLKKENREYVEEYLSDLDGITPKVTFAYHDVDGDRVDELYVNLDITKEDFDVDMINILYRFHNNRNVVKIFEKESRGYPLNTIEIMFDKPYIKDFFHPGFTVKEWKYYRLKNGKLSDEVEFSSYSGGAGEACGITKNKKYREMDWNTFHKLDKKYDSNKTVKTIPLTDVNLKKYRKTYNSTVLREYRNY